MKRNALSLLLGTTLLAIFAVDAQAGVHVGIGIGVVPPIVVAPPAYYTPPPPVYYPPPVYAAPPPIYYGPGIVVGGWLGHDGRDHDWRDDRGEHERWRDHHR
jgi:hypothetical protein